MLCTLLRFLDRLALRLSDLRVSLLDRSNRLVSRPSHFGRYGGRHWHSTAVDKKSTNRRNVGMDLAVDKRQDDYPQTRAARVRHRRAQATAQPDTRFHRFVRGACA